MTPDFTDAEQWMKWGYDHGWCGPAVCETHDGTPMSEDEYEYEDGCRHILRLYEDAQTKAAVERDHPPSVWRASNRWPAKTPDSGPIDPVPGQEPGDAGSPPGQKSDAANSGAVGVFRQ